METVVVRSGGVFGLGRDSLVRDDRDWLVREIPTSVRRRGSLIGTKRYWGMVSPEMRIDQGAEGTCVGHGCTNVLMAAPSEHLTFPGFITPNEAHMFARKLYYDASGDATYQEGTYTRLALDVLRARRQIAAYYRLTSVDEIVDVLLHTGPITFGSYWYESMFWPTSQLGNHYLRVDAGSGLAGGHLYCLTGVNTAPDAGPPYARMENSWGSGWGHNGTARISLDDLNVLYDGDAFLLTEEAF